MDEALREFVIGNWQLYKNNLDTPHSVLHFDYSGNISGCTNNEVFWEFSDEHLQILNRDRCTTTLIARSDIAVEQERMQGRFLGVYQGNNNISHIFRKVGLFHKSHEAFLSVATSDVDEAVELYRTNIDFTFIISDGITVQSPFHKDSQYVGNCVPDYREYVFDDHYQESPTFIHVLNNAKLVGGVVVVTADGVPVHETTYQAELRSRNFVRCMRDTNEGIYLNIPECYRIEDHPALLLNTLGDNYGHWHVQSLPNLTFVEKFKKAGLHDAENWLFYISNGYRYEAFRKESIDRFGYGHVLKVDPWASNPSGCIGFRKLLVPSLHRIPSQERFPSFLKEALAPLATAGKPNPDYPTKLYLSRKDIGTRRHIQNEDELIPALEKIGFTPIVCGEMSYAQQENVFANAQVILGPHGGALTNMAFAPAGTSIIEIFHGLQFNSWYKNLANILGHRYGFIGFDPPVEELDKGWSANFSVDVDAVVSLAEAMLASASVDPKP